MTSFEEQVWLQIKMLEAGQLVEALDHFLADYGIMYSNGAIVGEGLPACRRKYEQFVSLNSSISGHITDLFIDPHSEFCVFRQTGRYTDKQGVNHSVEGLHVQMWAQGKIAAEWQYSGEPMEGMIKRGLLKDPAHILELV